jgi:hypothetical protein
MTTTKRITDLSNYTSVLPYASEMFGVYQPMIGWRSRRTLDWYKSSAADNQATLIGQFTGHFVGDFDARFFPDNCEVNIGDLRIGRLETIRLIRQHRTKLASEVARLLPPDAPPVQEAWNAFINPDLLQQLLRDPVKGQHATDYVTECKSLHQHQAVLAEDDPMFDAQKASAALARSYEQRLDQESALAAALLQMFEMKLYAQIESVFYKKSDADLAAENIRLAALMNADDPFASFDPKRDLAHVSLSPLGIVHLFRQYFFELDTFLGTPTGHVWLSPGSTVELIEVSSRRTLLERVVEQSTETTKKTESSVTDRDEISEAVKEDNKSDLKLGASLTVNQSWGTGNATATASLNMEHTQSTARETTHKRMREQTEKLSTEIKQNYKSTFRTVTETTDTSSKRYLLTNTSSELVNYELRRKMRQVGVQVQNIGTYLCWESFVDDPGETLGLANLVHIAKPADIVTIPEVKQIEIPTDRAVTIPAVTLPWEEDQDRQYNGPDGFRVMSDGISIPPAPAGFEVRGSDDYVEMYQISGSGEDFAQTWTFLGKLRNGQHISAGVVCPPEGLYWDEGVTFAVGGVVWFTPNKATRDAVAAANLSNAAANLAALAQNERAMREALVNASKERIELASAINTRRYEDLREEERIVVYRKLIGTLLSECLYKVPDGPEKNRIRHALSELLNSIFDIEKMLYFVAPEWWKPRKHHHLLGQTAGKALTEQLTGWSDQAARLDNYYITDKSKFARMGSSLGWLLQLDGDDLRNAFLNAPWVKAVIPIRPGKELAATNWLQQMHVEGTDGLDSLYTAPTEELKKIRESLGITDVTIADALKYLCKRVAENHDDSLKVDKYPKEEIHDDNKVHATPIDRVYEHGFYKLEGGFRRQPLEPFEIHDQWIEVLPTDQIVPVPVKYDSITGRQKNE